MDERRLEAHLTGCRACTAWLAEAERVTRLARLAPAEPVPDRTAEILAAVGPPRRGMRPGELLVRAGLALIAVAQLVLAWPSLILGVDAMAQSMHVAHETGAWNAALAVAFAWVAVRPRHAAGLLPLLGVYVVILVAISVGDLINGDVHPGRVSTHILAVTALGLVAALLWVRHDPRPAGGRGGGLRPDWLLLGGDDPGVADGDDPGMPWRSRPATGEQRRGTAA